MNKRIKYDFKIKDAFGAFLVPAIFLPLYFSQDLSIIPRLLVFYALPAWLLSRFSYTAIRVTDDTIIVINRLKPFKKIYRYTYQDLLKIGIGNGKTSLRIVFFFPGKKKFIGDHSYNRGQICKFFLDKGIKVGSGDENLKHFISHYQNDPQANYIRRQLRKEKRRNR